MKPSYLVFDTLDDRRELHALLHRLPPAARVAFLEECCRRVADARGNGPRPVPSMRAVMVPDAVRCDRGDDRLTAAVYSDIVALAHQHGLDLARVALDLERFARGRHPAAAGCTFRRAE